MVCIVGFDGCAEPSYASESAAAIMTLVFQQTDNGGMSKVLQKRQWQKCNAAMTTLVCLREEVPITSQTITNTRSLSSFYCRYVILLLHIASSTDFVSIYKV